MSENLNFNPVEIDKVMEKEKKPGLRELLTKYSPVVAHTHTSFSNPETRHEADYTAEQIRDYVQEQMNNAKGSAQCVVFAEHPSDAGNPKLVDGKDLLDHHRQIHEIRDTQESGPKLYSGVESSIISAEGDLDVPDEVLSQLDIVIASKHDMRHVFPESNGNPNAEQLTKMYSNLMDNPNVDVIGHPNRYVQDEEGNPNTTLKQMDWEGLIAKARDTHTALEINFNAPMPVWLIKKTVEGGAPIFIGTDAHTLKDFQQLPEDVQISSEDERLNYPLNAKIKFWRRTVYRLLKALDDAGATPDQVITSSSERLGDWLSQEKAGRKIESNET